MIGFQNYFTYSQIAVACRFLRKDPECLFVATNGDTTFPAGKGLLLPGTGSIVACLDASVDQKPIFCGKPHKILFDMIQQK